MPDYAYIARDSRGTKVNGTVAAGSEREALSMITGQSLFPISVSVSKQPVSFGGKRISGQLLSATYSQIAALLRSGVPLLRSLSVIKEQTSNVRLKEVLTEIHGRVEEGTSIGEAMARHPRIFSEMAINMVRAGGEGGFLEDALERVAQFTEQQEELKGRTMGALAYPAFLAIVGTAIVLGLLIFFVPQFGELFKDLRSRGQMPALTEGLLTTSDLMRTWWWIAALALFFAGVFIKSYLGTVEGRLRSDGWRLKAPLLGKVFSNLAVARFCRVLGTLLKNGVPILKSLEISRDAAGNRILSNAIAKASENISSGQALAKPLAACGYFPRDVVEMIAVAEESNTLDRVLVEVADGLERRTFRQLDIIVRLLEPMMLLILAAIVLLVVLALMMPIIKMSSSVG